MWPSLSPHLLQPAHPPGGTGRPLCEALRSWLPVPRGPGGARGPLYLTRGLPPSPAHWGPATQTSAQPWPVARTPGLIRSEASPWRRAPTLARAMERVPHPGTGVLCPTKTSPCSIRSSKIGASPTAYLCVCVFSPGAGMVGLGIWGTAAVSVPRIREVAAVGAEPSLLAPTVPWCCLGNPAMEGGPRYPGPSSVLTLCHKRSPWSPHWYLCGSMWNPVRRLRGTEKGLSFPTWHSLSS